MNTTINIVTTSELKTKADEVLNRLGLNMSTAVNIFLTQIVSKNAFPFEISVPPRKTPKLGGWKGKGYVSDDFDEPMEQFEEYTR